MRELIAESINGADSLVVVEAGLVSVLRQLEARYVAGKVSSDGDDKIPENIARLISYTEAIRNAIDSPAVFSAADVFNQDLFQRLPEMRLPRVQREEHFRRFWRNVFSAGVISHVYMTPGWSLSPGATDEHETARQLGIKHEFVEHRGGLIVFRSCC